MNDLAKKIYGLFLILQKKAMRLYRLSYFLNQRKSTRYLRAFPWLHLIKKYNCYISPKAIIQENLYLPHPSGVVIGDGVRIGKNCIIYQQVTIGAKKKGDGKKNLYPEIGNNVTIYAGAKILGAVKIGEGASIGANSVVNCDVPPYSVAVGIPCRIINSR